MFYSGVHLKTQLQCNEYEGEMFLVPTTTSYYGNHTQDVFMQL